MSTLANIPEKIRDTIMSIGLIVPVIITGTFSSLNPLNITITTAAACILVSVLYLRGKSLVTYFRSPDFATKQVFEILLFILCFYIFVSAFMMLAFIGYQSIAYLLF